MKHLVSIAACLLAGAPATIPAAAPLALDLNPQWTLFLRPDLAAVELRALDRVPSELGGAAAQAVVFTNGIHAIREERYSVRTPAVLMNEFESPVEGVMQIGCGADWFFEFIVNGVPVYDTLRYGNESIAYSIENHVFDIPVRKGRNLVVVRLLSGSQGWRFFYGRPGWRDLAAEAPTAENFRVRTPEIYTTSMFEPSPARDSLLRLLQNGIDQVEPRDCREHFARRGDAEASGADAAPTLPLFHFYETAFDRVLAGVASATVPEGSVAFWHVYNLGYVVKTHNQCFGVDLAHRRAAELAPRLDFLLVTHAHGDHFSMPLVAAMQALGKPVVSNFLGPDAAAGHPGRFAFGDIQIASRPVDHNATLTNFVVTYEIACGSGPDACVILHTGDAAVVEQLVHEKPIDIWMVHPHVGVDVVRGAEALKPALTLVSHLQELQHPRDNARWNYVYGAHEVLRLAARGHRAAFPLWGEKTLWSREAKRQEPRP